jgi:hypothetical protein
MLMINNSTRGLGGLQLPGPSFGELLVSFALIFISLFEEANGLYVFTAT